MMDKRLHSFSALHCQQLVDAWHEPCIVFASHWSLRTGPSVHLLHRWHRNPNCLLVMVEAMMDIDVVLSPFKPMAMQLLQCPFLSGLRFNEIASVMKKLQPKLVLFPEAFQKRIHIMALKEQSVLFYCKGQTLRIPCLKDEIEVDMATDLAFQLRPKQVGHEKSTVTKLKAELHREDGRFLLKSTAPSCQSSTLSNQKCGKGVVNSDNLLLALRDQGLCASIEDDVTSEMVSKDDKENDRNALQIIVKISSPSKAIIEVRDKDISIRTDDVAICDNIFNALDSIMHVT